SCAGDDRAKRSGASALHHALPRFPTGISSVRAAMRSGRCSPAATSRVIRPDTIAAAGMPPLTCPARP
ncbi:hypothetical protein, partial [Salmonella enterica]|uniref:hypothetical protein n=1 Tax=Salmonella enterica TaxID=28901 RepID=UPI001C608BE6